MFKSDERHEYGYHNADRNKNNTKRFILFLLSTFLNAIIVMCNILI